MYTEKVMDHFANPRNVGEMLDADGIGETGNPVCGDIMRVYIKVKDNIIEDIKFKTFGCGAAIATSSMVTEMAKGKSLEEALELSNRQVAEALGGLPLSRCTAPTWLLTPCMQLLIIIAKNKQVIKVKVFLGMSGAVDNSVAAGACFPAH